MKDYLLEVCVDSVESALEAQKGGANRLEVCSNLIIGGTTPGLSLVREIKKRVDLTSHVLIRPRFGDFYYTDYEFDIMKEDIKMFRELGVEGVVIGILNKDGNLDMPRMEQLIQEADPMSITLHRAFDVCKNPLFTLERAKNLGIQTILTSGQADHCLHGQPLLAVLLQKAEYAIDIMVGCGVTAQVIKQIYPQVKAHTFHMSGKESLPSKMLYQNECVHMGLPGFSEYELLRTSAKEIAEAVKVLKNL
ncbi:copper homeostasis protein CutC [Lachnospiraceae bacterium ZAX-1]